MNWSDFESVVFAGNHDTYVDTEVLEFLRENAAFEVIERSALEKDEIDQEKLFSVSLPVATEKRFDTDEELIETVKEKMVSEGRDTQKYQLRHNGNTPDTVQIWKHGHGYSVFVIDSDS